MLRIALLVVALALTAGSANAQFRSCPNCPTGPGYSTPAPRLTVPGCANGQCTLPAKPALTTPGCANGVCNVPQKTAKADCPCGPACKCPNCDCVNGKCVAGCACTQKAVPASGPKYWVKAVQGNRVVYIPVY